MRGMTDSAPVSRDTIVLDSSKQASDSFVRRFVVRPFEYLNTVTAFVVLAALLILAIPVGYLRIAISPSSRIRTWNEFFRSIALIYFYMAGVRIVIEGLHHLEPKDHPVVLAANHTSYLDGVLLDIAANGRPATGLVAPFHSFLWPFSFWLKVIGSIEVARTHEEHREYRSSRFGGDVVRQSVSRITERGHSIMICPEGHIEQHHTLLPFKTGAVRIARQAGVPLVPMTIRGTTRVFTNSWLVLPGTITLTIHQPIILTGKRASRDKVIQDTYRLLRSIARALPADYHTPSLREAILAAGHDNPVPQA